MLSFVESVLRALALGVFALYLLLAIPSTFLRTARWVKQAVAVAHEDSLAMRRRFLTVPYVATIDQIRRTIPRTGEYLVINGEPEWGGGPLWLRFELAPRRARFLGLLSELPDADTLRRTMPAGPRWIIIAFAEPRPPILMRREDFLRALEGFHGGA